MPEIVGAVYENLAARFKGVFTYEEEEFTIGTTPVLIRGNDIERVSLLVQNTGATVFYIGPSAGVSATRGIRLGPTGGLASMDVYEDSILPAVSWYAVSSAGGGTLYVLSTKRVTIFPSGE